MLVAQKQETCDWHLLWMVLATALNLLLSCVQCRQARLVSQSILPAAFLQIFSRHARNE